MTTPSYAELVYGPSFWLEPGRTVQLVNTNGRLAGTAKIQQSAHPRDVTKTTIFPLLQCTLEDGRTVYVEPADGMPRQVFQKDIQQHERLFAIWTLQMLFSLNVETVDTVQSDHVPVVHAIETVDGRYRLYIVVENRLTNITALVAAAVNISYNRANRTISNTDADIQSLIDNYLSQAIFGNEQLSRVHYSIETN